MMAEARKDSAAESVAAILAPGLAELAGETLVQPRVFNRVAEHYGYTPQTKIPGPIGHLPGAEAAARRPRCAPRQEGRALHAGLHQGDGTATGSSPASKAMFPCCAWLPIGLSFAPGRERRMGYEAALAGYEKFAFDDGRWTRPSIAAAPAPRSSSSTRCRACIRW